MGTCLVIPRLAAPVSPGSSLSGLPVCSALLHYLRFSRTWWSHLCVSSHPRAFTRAISSLEYPPPSYSSLPLSFLLINPLFLCSPDSFQAEFSLMLQTESSPQLSSLTALGPSSLALITDTLSFVEDHWMASSSQTVIFLRIGFVSHSFHPGYPLPSALPGTQ